MTDQHQADTTLLKRVHRVNFFNKFELDELPRVLLPDEQVLGILGGLYTAGTAILCVTSRRLLLIDKKFIRLNFEDVRFEAISEVNYSSQLVLASVQFFFGGRVLKFRSWYKKELRDVAQFVQNKMFEARNPSHRGYADIDGRQYHATAVPLDAPVTMNQVAEKHVFTSNDRAGVPTPKLETFLQNRHSGWNRAYKLNDTISSVKFGRRILKIALSRS